MNGGYRVFVCGVWVWLAILSLVGTSAGANYYVATNGSDSGAGSLAAPWRTFAKAYAAASAGDTVYFRGGTYAATSGLGISKSGTAADPIVFAAYPGEVPVFDGPHWGDNANTPSAFLVSGSFWTFRGLRVTDWVFAFNYFGGAPRSIRVENCEIDNIYRGAVYSSAAAANCSYVSNTIHDVVIENQPAGDPHAAGWACALDLNGTNQSAEYNRIYQTYGEGIGCYGDSPVVRGNMLHDNFSAEIYVCNTVNATIEKNFLLTTGTGKTRTLYGYTGQAVGIQISNEGASAPPVRNARIVNNIIVGPQRLWPLFWWNAAGTNGMEDCVIAHNTCVGGKAAAIKIENDAHRNSAIKNNIFHKGTAPNLQQIATSSGLHFDHNNWFGGPAGLAVGMNDVTADPALIDVVGTTPEAFQQTGSSPCIDRADAFAEGPADDFWGTPRGGSPDIGAHEFSASNTLVVAAPVFDPAAGSYVSPVGVAISSGTLGASLRFTTDGSTPSDTAGTPYTGPVILTNDTQLSAIAYRGGWGNSAVRTAIYAVTNRSVNVNWNGFAHCMRIVFSGYNRSEPLVNFPVLVKVSTNIAGFEYGDFADGGGGDLRFGSEDDSTILNHEIDEWQTAGESYVWVQVPALTNDASIWAHWGNPVDVTPPPYTTNGATWSEGYVGVWHLREAMGNLVNAASGGMNNNGVPVGTRPARAAGVIGYGQFNGTAAYNGFNVGDLGLVGPWSYTLTIEAFFWSNSASGSDKIVCCRGGGAYNYTLQKASSSGHYLRATIADTEGPDALFPYLPAVWHYGAVAYDGRIDNGRHVMVDGAVTNDPMTGSAIDGTAADTTLFMRLDKNHDFVGALDEVRISGVTRSTNWLWATWFNVMSNGLFCTYTVITNEPPAVTAVHQTPIAWYAGHGMSPGEAGVISWEALDDVDTDIDGLLNWEEYVAGTVPTDRFSVLRFSAMAPTNPAGLVLVFATSSNRAYWVETRSALSAAGDWDPLTNFRSVLPEIMQITDETPSGGALFYRVRVGPP